MSLPFAQTTRSLTADSSRLTGFGWLFCSLMLTAWAGWFFLVQVTVFEVSDDARLEVEQNAFPIHTPSAGKIVRSNLSLGRWVEAGEILAELDSSRERIQLEEEEANLKALPAQIAALQREIEAQSAARNEDRLATSSGLESARAHQREAAAAATFAVEQARRTSQLGHSKLVAEVDVLRAEADAEKLAASRQAWSAEVQRLERDQQTRSHEKQAIIADRQRQADQLAGRLESVKASVARLRQEIENRQLRAPGTGRLGDIRPLQVGAYVAAGDKLGTVVPEGALRIVAQFRPDSVLGRIRPGQAARLRLHGFPWTQYGSIPAHVTEIASEVRDDRVRVEFAPEAVVASPMLLQHGLPGSIEVDIEQATPALLVLRAAGNKLSGARPAMDSQAAPAGRS